MKVNKKQKRSGNGAGKARVNPPRKRGNPNGANRSQPRQRAAAVSYSTGNVGRAPQVSMSKDSVRVVHRELLTGNVAGAASAAFTVNNTFALNPGLVGTFPWLSNMAQNWEAYRFNKVRICWFPKTGTATAGSAYIVPDYDASDSAPISEQIASQYEDMIEDAPWTSFCCELRPNAMFTNGPRKYIRAGSLSANQDIKMYDAANIFICTSDSAAAAGWGKVWIEYDVSLFTPQTNSGGSNFSTISSLDGVAPLTSTNLFGTAALIAGNSGATAAANVVTLPQLIIGAEYFFSCSIIGTVITAFTVSGATGLTVKSTLFTGFPAAATSANNTVTFTATATSGTITQTCTATTVTDNNSVFCLLPTSVF